MQTGSKGTLHATFQKGAGNGFPPDKALIELGKVVSSFQALEMHLTRLFAALSGCDLATSIVCFWGQNASAKREVIESLAYQRFQVGDGLRERVRKAMVHFKAISEDRNRIVHSLWTEEDGEWKRLFLSSSAEKTDLFLGGDAERSDKSQSLRAKFTYSVADMGDVLDKMQAFIAEVEAIMNSDNLAPT